MSRMATPTRETPKKSDRQTKGAVLVCPAIGDIGGGIGADGVEAPLSQRELAVEAVNQVEAEGDDGHNGAQVEDRTPEVVEQAQEHAGAGRSQKWRAPRQRR